MGNIATEPVDVINRRLVDHYGETEDFGVRRPNFRIVWSEDQLEMRRTEYSDSGMLLVTPEVRQLPKYRQWIKEKHVLERLTVVPFFNEQDLPASKLSYEPIWVFEDGKGQALPAAWIVSKFVVDSIHQAMEKAGVYTKYKDKNETKEELTLRLKAIEDEMFANESRTGDSLAHKEAVSMAGLDGRSNTEGKEAE